MLFAVDLANSATNVLARLYELSIVDSPHLTSQVRTQVDLASVVTNLTMITNQRVTNQANLTNPL
jgi:hypothetical protein